jgi:hypothetical protein
MAKRAIRFSAAGDEGAGDVGTGGNGAEESSVGATCASARSMAATKTALHAGQRTDCPISRSFNCKLRLHPGQLILIGIG